MATSVGKTHMLNLFFGLPSHYFYQTFLPLLLIGNKTNLLQRIVAIFETFGLSLVYIEVC